MRKIFVFLYLVFLVPFLAVVILMKSHAAENPPENRLGFQLTYADGKTAKFTKDRFTGKVILYFFEPGCDLCRSEVEELMTYASDQNIQVLFVTTGDLAKAKAFERGVRSLGKETSYSFARIEGEEVIRIFPEAKAPQAILFGPGLELRGMREEIISYEFLESTFE